MQRVSTRRSWINALLLILTGAQKKAEIFLPFLLLFLQNRKANELLAQRHDLMS